MTFGFESRGRRTLAPVSAAAPDDSKRRLDTVVESQPSHLVIAAVAQFERELIVERTRAALAAAKAQNRQLGRLNNLN